MTNRVLSNIVIKEEIKHKIIQYENDDYIQEYDYIEVELYDESNNLIEIREWQTDGDIPTKEEFLIHSKLEYNKSIWTNI